MLIHAHTHIKKKKNYSHTAWICFLSDERDYGIKKARPEQFSSVWSKAALCSGTMINTDECLTAHGGIRWHGGQRVSTGARNWSLTEAVDLFSLSDNQEKSTLFLVRSVGNETKSVEEGICSSKGLAALLLQVEASIGTFFFVNESVVAFLFCFFILFY